MLIYVASLSPPEEYRGFYSQAAAEILKLGHQPFDPWSNGALLPWPVRLEALMQKCQGIYLLKGWQNSPEACIERHVSLGTGKVILFQSVEERKSALDQEKQAVIDRILGAIHEATGLTLEEFRIHSRKEEYVFARMIFSYHCHRSGMEPKDICSVLPWNKSMIYHYLNRYKDECKFTPAFRKTAAEVDQILGL